MAIITIADLAPGMVVAAAVTDRSGRMLLAAGAEITAKNLRTLRTWGVLEVDVEGQDAVVHHVEESVSAEELQAATQLLQPVWRNVDLTIPVMNELFRLCVLRKAQHDRC